MKKQIIAFIITIIIIFGVSMALGDTEYKIDEQGIIKSYENDSENIIIPSSVSGIKAYAVGDSLFYLNKNIKILNIEEGILRVESSGFYTCDNLEEVKLPNSLQAIDEYAFFACKKLKKLIIPAGVCYIGDNAFAFCENLEEIEFLGELPIIGKDAFNTISPNIKIKVPIEEKAKYDEALGLACEAEEKCIYVDNSAKEEDFVLDENGALIQYNGTSAKLDIPERINGKTVKVIGERCFFVNKNIRLVLLPETVTNIGREAFFGSGLKYIQIQEGLLKIEKAAFSGCRLWDFKLPNSLETIEDRAFYAIKSKEITISENIKNIPQSAFESSNVENLYLPENIENIEEKAFAGCSALGYIVFKSEMPPNIASTAFENCPIEDIDIPSNASRDIAKKYKELFVQLGFVEGSFNVWRADLENQAPYPSGDASTFDMDEKTGLVTKLITEDERMTMFWDGWCGQEKVKIKGIDKALFKNSIIKEFVVPHSDTFEVISDNAFENSQLEKIDLFDSVKYIGKQAFKDCVNLEEIILPDSLEYIGDEAFEGCINLKRVMFLGNSIELNKDIFLNCNSLESLILPEKIKANGNVSVDISKIRINEYASDEDLKEIAKTLEYPWYLKPLRVGEESKYLVMPNTPNAAEDFEFDKKNGIIIRYIGNKENCVVPNQIDGIDVVGIGYSAFPNYISKEENFVGDNEVDIIDIVRIGFSTFSNYIGRKGNYIIPNKFDVIDVVGIGIGAFSNFIIEKFVQDNPDKHENMSLKTVVLPNTVKEIQDSAFVECKSLISFECYGPVERIGIRAFEGCDALNKVIFYNGVKSVDDYCFYLNKTLEQVHLGDFLQRIGEGAFQGTGIKAVEVYANEVGNMAYFDCNNLEQVHILNSVKMVGDSAFAGENKLKEAYLDLADSDIYGDMAFNSSTKIYVPENTDDTKLEQFIKSFKEKMISFDIVVEKKDFSK